MPFYVLTNAQSNINDILTLQHIKICYIFIKKILALFARMSYNKLDIFLKRRYIVWKVHTFYPLFLQALP